MCIGICQIGLIQCPSWPRWTVWNGEKFFLKQKLVRANVLIPDWHRYKGHWWIEPWTWTDQLDSSSVNACSHYKLTSCEYEECCLRSAAERIAIAASCCSLNVDCSRRVTHLWDFCTVLLYCVAAGVLEQDTSIAATFLHFSIWPLQLCCRTWRGLAVSLAVS